MDTHVGRHGGVGFFLLFELSCCFFFLPSILASFNKVTGLTGSHDLEFVIVCTRVWSVRKGA